MAVAIDFAELTLDKIREARENLGDLIVTTPSRRWRGKEIEDVCRGFVARVQYAEI